MDTKDMLNVEKELSIDDKLFLNKFKVYTEAHIKLKDKEICRKCAEKPCLYVCPVENYKKENGEVTLSWEGCLECGACRIACSKDAIEWENPQGGFGVKFRQG